MFKKLSIVVLVLMVLYACKKSEDFDKATADQFAGRYCNDPEAINYNFEFPGTEDNSTCIYPTDVFTGSYSLKDSIYNGEFELDTVLDYTVTFHVKSITSLKMSGFCINGDSVRLTADRYYKAQVDSTLIPLDSSMIEGHTFCRGLDTIKGSITRMSINDTDKIRINFIIASDTGINYHIGTGIKK